MSEARELAGVIVLAIFAFLVLDTMVDAWRAVATVCATVHHGGCGEVSP